MNSAQRSLRIAERSTLTGFITIGIALMSSFLTSEGIAAVVWPVIGVGLFGVGASGLARRLIRAPAQRMGSGMVIGLSLFTSLLAAVFLAVLPVVLRLANDIGMSIPSEFLAGAVIAGLTSLANVGVLVFNIIDLTRRETAP